MSLLYKIAVDMSSEEFHKAIGVSLDASPKEKKKAYYNWMRSNHPDKQGSHDMAARMNTAFDAYGRESKPQQGFDVKPEDPKPKPEQHAAPNGGATTQQTSQGAGGSASTNNASTNNAANKNPSTPGNNKPKLSTRIKNFGSRQMNKVRNMSTKGKAGLAVGGALAAAGTAYGLHSAYKNRQENRQQGNNVKSLNS